MSLRITTRSISGIIWLLSMGVLFTTPSIAQDVPAIPRSAISQANSFVLARDGQSFFYNYDAGLVGRPFLPHVFKAFGFSFDAQQFLYLRANGKFPTFELYSRDLITGKERQITDAPVHHAVWSP